MSQIDWSKARDGFDFHFKPRVGNDAGGFYMVSPLNDRFVGDLGNYILFRDMSDVAGLFIVSTRPELAPWTGEGLPPVGATFEACNRGDGNWRKAVMLFVGRELGVMLLDTGPEYSFYVNEWEYRPIRTPEQIAAEERAKAIDQMVIDSQHPIAQLMRDSIFAELYAQGYRKFEIVDN